MTQYGTFTARPLPKSARNGLGDIFKVYVSSTVLQLKGIKVNQVCALQSDDGKWKPVIVWPASEKIQDTVVLTSKALQNIYEFKLGDKVSLVELTDQIPEAQSCALSEVPTSAKSDLDDISDDDCPHWAWLLRRALADTELLVVGMIIENVTAWDQTRSFRISKLNGSSKPSTCRNTADFAVTVEINENLQAQVAAGKTQLSITARNLSGLDQQIQQLNEELTNYSDGAEMFEMPPWYQPLARGILLHGPSGTGKSLVLNNICQAGWRSVFHLNDEIEEFARVSEKITALRRTFADAQRYQPSLIVIDDMQILLGNEEPQKASRATAISRNLGREMDHLGQSRTLVVASVRSPIEIDQSLRSQFRFSVEIEVPVPTSTSRTAILKSLTGLSQDQSSKLLDHVASQTHGYVRADLYRLTHVAAKKAKLRMQELVVLRNDLSVNPKRVDLTIDDYEAAMREVRPSAMREIFIETPRVKWTDIGGQEAVKKALERSLVWPSKVRSAT